jgi:hypothetical protein
MDRSEKSAQSRVTVFGDFLPETPSTGTTYLGRDSDVGPLACAPLLSSDTSLGRDALKVQTTLRW